MGLFDSAASRAVLFEPLMYCAASARVRRQALWMRHDAPSRDVSWRRTLAEHQQASQTCGSLSKQTGQECRIRIARDPAEAVS
jgi:hypothetical protein